MGAKANFNTGTTAERNFASLDKNDLDNKEILSSRDIAFLEEEIKTNNRPSVNSNNEIPKDSLINLRLPKRFRK